MPKGRAASSGAAWMPRKRLDNFRVRHFLDGKATCSVPREDCGPRREEPLPPTGRAGCVV
jgi:hypothetical protein